MKIEEFDLPFDEALEYWAKKGLKLNPGNWRKIWQEANHRAFTVAHVSAIDVLEDIKKEVNNAIENGIGFDVFQETLEKKLREKGWLKPKGEKAWIVMPDGSRRKRLTGWRLETIFRTNLQSAYQVGRYEQMQEVRDMRPYWQYHAILDANTRPTHAAQDGKIYKADDPYWDEWYPPSGFGCRCYVTTLSARQVADKEVLTGKAKERPDEGWRYNVGKTGLGDWKPDLRGYSEQGKRLYNKYVDKSKK